MKEDKKNPFGKQMCESIGFSGDSSFWFTGGAGTGRQLLYQQAAVRQKSGINNNFNKI